MDERILKQKTFDNTLEWNEAGYDGTGITVWNMESNATHGIMSRQRILDAAPNATAINATHGLVIKNKMLIKEEVYDDGIAIPADFFIDRHNISILTQSHGGGSDSRYAAITDLYRLLRTKHNLTLFNSTGNDGSDGVKGGALPPTEAIYVGACMMFKDNANDIRMCNYSSLGDEYEEVDFSTFVGKAGVNGTSFSTPYLAGIAALLQQRYGRDLTSGEIYQYFKMIAQPIDSGHPCDKHERYDYWSGYGIPILPKVDKKFIRMTVGSKEYKVDEGTCVMDVAPFIRFQRTFVPVAFVALALGASVIWNDRDKSVTMYKGDDAIKMWVGEHFYHHNENAYYMDVVPIIQDRRTFVPIAWVAEGLNCKIGWVADKQEVLIIEG